jgi:hypothetical protein
MRFGGKTFYFVRKSPWSISEAAGAFCIEQAQKIIGGSKLPPLRCGLRTVLVRHHRPNPAIGATGADPKATLFPGFLFFLFTFSFFSFEPMASRCDEMLPNRNNALLSNNSNAMLF